MILMLATNEFSIVNSHSSVDSLRDIANAENLYMSSFLKVLLYISLHYEPWMKEIGKNVWRIRP